jgi:hypothetical protein
MSFLTVHRALLIPTVSLIILAVPSCSMFQDYESKRPANIAKTESMLDQAGFRKVSIETPDQHGAVSELSLHRLNRYESASGNVYWYADPDLCGCLYSGDENAYGRYAMLMQQEQDTAQYIENTDREQLGMLGPFGNAFPPPVIFGGGWPVMIVPAGGGGGGVGRGGGGGGTFGHPGGNGHGGGGGHGHGHR